MPRKCNGLANPTRLAARFSARSGCSDLRTRRPLVSPEREEENEGREHRHVTRELIARRRNARQCARHRCRLAVGSRLTLLKAASREKRAKDGERERERNGEEGSRVVDHVECKIEPQIRRHQRPGRTDRLGISQAERARARLRLLSARTLNRRSAAV